MASNINNTIHWWSDKLNNSVMLLKTVFLWNILTNCTQAYLHSRTRDTRHIGQRKIFSLTNVASIFKLHVNTTDKFSIILPNCILIKIIKKAKKWFQHTSWQTTLSITLPRLNTVCRSKGYEITGVHCRLLTLFCYFWGD